MIESEIGFKYAFQILPPAAPLQRGVGEGYGCFCHLQDYPAVYVGESETTASVGLYIHLIFIFTLDSPSIVRRRFIRAETRWL